MSVKLLKFDDATADIAPVTVSDTIEVGQVMLDGVGGIALNAGACLLSNLADPMAPYDAATKGYVDSVVQSYAQSGYPSDGTTTNSGPQGKDGKSILAGQAAPTNSLGNVGDLYVELDGPFLWGPKATNGWPTAVVNLRGPQGERGVAGVPGYSIRPSSQNPPSNTLGNNGDYALTAQGLLYGPRASGSYPSTPLNLIGPRGAEGQRGSDGQSVVGPMGASILYSPDTPPAYSIGNTGDLVVTAAGQVFGPKTSSGWGSAIFSLVGPKGDVGAASVTPGPSGNGVRTSQSDPPTSALGVDGDYAISPLSRLYGPRSNGTWPAAYVSLVGPKGDSIKGDVGDVGPRGASVLYSNNNPPLASLGLNNDFAVTFDGQLFGPKSAGAWGQVTLSLVGPAGKDGVGQQGVRGNSVLQAQSDPPSDGLGVVGDYAISPSAVLYGPKPSSNMWQSGGVLLVGPRGAASTTPGPSGLSVVSGNGAPTTQGNVGDIYVDVQNGNLYAAKTSSGWASSFTSLIGPRGPIGSQGGRGPGVYKTTIYSSQDNLPTAGYITGDSLLTSDNFIFTPFSANNGWPAVGFSLVGPRGATGATGQSITGPQGYSIDSGKGAPASNVGVVGDAGYLDYQNAALYGPKTSSGWPTTFVSLIGPKGADSQVPGARGSQIYNGTGPPSSDLTTYSPNGPAQAGDLYLATDTQKLYVLGSS